MNGNGVNGTQIEAEPSGAAPRVRPPGEERVISRATLNRPMLALKAAKLADRTATQRIADGLIAAGSSTPFLVVHAVWFTGWITWNMGLVGIPVVDPLPFGLLTMCVSLEAIFLSIFVLIAQRRESAMAELREELTLQINLRIEAEVTKGLQLVAGLYTRMGYRFSEDDELREMLKEMDPESMERDLQEQIKKVTTGNRERGT
ncbi:MAG: DUF1003 domain-containing protein [Gemmatimonadota bacterium]